MSKPTLSNGVPPLTDRQKERLNEWLEEVSWRSETPYQYNDLSWNVKDATSPDRGHDIVVSAVDADYIHALYMDPYGHGAESWGNVFWEHNSSEDECDCEKCLQEAMSDE